MSSFLFYKLWNPHSHGCTLWELNKIEYADAAKEATSGSLSQSFLNGRPQKIKVVHFDQALRKISPSVSDKVWITCSLCHFILIEVMGELGDKSEHVPN